MKPNQIGLKDKVKYSNLGDKQFLNEIIDFYFENQKPQGKIVEPLNEVIEVAADNPRNKEVSLYLKEEVDIDNLDRQKLFDIAKTLNIPKYSRLKTEDLKKAIKEA